MSSKQRNGQEMEGRTKMDQPEGMEWTWKEWNGHGARWNGMEDGMDNGWKRRSYGSNWQESRYWGGSRNQKQCLKFEKNDLKWQNSEDTAIKSYYIENLLYNVPNNLFAGTYKDRFSSILEKTNQRTLTAMLFLTINVQNGIHELYCRKYLETRIT